MKKKFLGLLIGLFLGGQTVQAVDNDAAFGIGTAGFVAAGIAAYQASQKLLDEHSRWAAVTIAAAGIVWTACWFRAAEYFRYRKIENHLDFIELKGNWARRKALYHSQHYLFNVAITDDNFDTTLQETDCESVDFPLIVMFKRLQQADALLVRLRKLSDTAMFNTTRKQGSFYAKLLVQRNRLDEIMKRVRGNISAVKKHPMWLEQWKMYQKRDMSTMTRHIQLMPV